MIGVFTVKHVPKENERLMCLKVSYADNLKFANSLDPGQARRNVIGQRVTKCAGAHLSQCTRFGYLLCLKASFKEFFHAFCRLLIFFKTNFFQKNLFSE